MHSSQEMNKHFIILNYLLILKAKLIVNDLHCNLTDNKNQFNLNRDYFQSFVDSKYST